MDKNKATIIGIVASLVLVSSVAFIARSLYAYAQTPQQEAAEQIPVVQREIEKDRPAHDRFEENTQKLEKLVACVQKNECPLAKGTTPAL